MVRLRATKNIAAAKPIVISEHRAGRELAVDERFAEPVANASALSPESKRAQAVGVGALVMADGFLEITVRDHAVPFERRRERHHRHAQQHGGDHAAANERIAWRRGDPSSSQARRERTTPGKTPSPTRHQQRAGGHRTRRNANATIETAGGAMCEINVMPPIVSRGRQRPSHTRCRNRARPAPKRPRDSRAASRWRRSPRIRSGGT